MSDSASEPCPERVGLDTGLIHEIVLVDLVCREHLSSFRSSSLPGHLIHYIIEGEVHQRWGGHTQYLSPGNTVWYYQDQITTGEIQCAPWRFYTVNFIAPALSPPPFDQQVAKPGAAVAQRFAALLAAWRNHDVGPIQRQLAVHARLLDLLALMIPSQSEGFLMNSTTEGWWQVETKIRRALDQPWTLDELQTAAAVSIRSLNRACHRATGMSPMQRIKQIRLSYAKGLLLYSTLRISEIAQAVAYRRPQEFSRDYRQHYSLTPTQERRRGRDYRTLET
jgi:AraC-like DNA-binding protein